MPWYKNHWKATEGNPVSAKGLVGMAKTCDWITKLRVAPPLTLTNTGGGPLIGLGGAPSDTAFLAVTHGTITANAVVTSGTKWTPGTGSVYAVAYDGTHLNTDTSTTYDVLNFSTTTGGIATNTLVWVDYDDNGDLYVVQIDCGN